MYQILKKNWTNNRYIIISGLVLSFLLLLTVVYKNDEEIRQKSKSTQIYYESPDLKTFKKFILNQIKSPFINISYEIKKGDTILKILKRYKVNNSDIETVIKQYKKYGKPNQLLVGNKIDITIEEKLKSDKNSLIKFSVPITKSTTIAINKNEENKIVSEKIITKLYKKKILSENIIKNNLYSSAIKANINPDTIIEFARILGYEIDFQRDIRKND